jgi:hypothetical protein
MDAATITIAPPFPGRHDVLPRQASQFYMQPETPQTTLEMVRPWKKGFPVEQRVPGVHLDHVAGVLGLFRARIASRSFHLTLTDPSPI